MGNNMVPSSSSAKVMKINGELIKIKTPSKVHDLIKDYPDHILLDSDEFRKFNNLRGPKPLDPQHDLKPRKLYLLVELPKFPSPLRRTQSSVVESTVKTTTRRCLSDDLSSIIDDVGPTPSRRRVKMRVPKADVDRIMKESKDDVEVGRKILSLAVADGGDAVAHGEERGSRAEGRRCFSVTCSPCSSYRSKYKKLTS